MGHTWFQDSHILVHLWFQLIHSLGHSWPQADHSMVHLWFQANHSLDHIWFPSWSWQDHIRNFVWSIWRHVMVRLWSAWSENLGCSKGCSKFAIISNKFLRIIDQFLMKQLLVNQIEVWSCTLDNTKERNVKHIFWTNVGIKKLNLWNNTAIVLEDEDNTQEYEQERKELFHRDKV